MKDRLTIIKVGGKIVEENDTLNVLLNDYAKVEGRKILVHGGGRSATKNLRPSVFTDGLFYSLKSSGL